MGTRYAVLCLVALLSLGACSNRPQSSPTTAPSSVPTSSPTLEPKVTHKKNSPEARREAKQAKFTELRKHTKLVLQVYFGRKFRTDCTAEFRFVDGDPIRTGPYPHGHGVWVKVIGPIGQILTEGAALVAVTGKEKFEVRELLSRESILAAPQDVEKFFPSSMVIVIWHLAGQESK